MRPRYNGRMHAKQPSSAISRAMLVQQWPEGTEVHLTPDGSGGAIITPAAREAMKGIKLVPSDAAPVEQDMTEQDWNDLINDARGG